MLGAHWPQRGCAGRAKFSIALPPGLWAMGTAPVMTVMSQADIEVTLPDHYGAVQGS